MSGKTIVREGYHRKGYYRSGYVTKTGAKVAPTYVSPSDVPPVRIPARGKATVTGQKGQKLIDMEDYRHLSNYGYSLSADADTRKKALRQAAAAEGFAWPIHRLSAISTLTRNTNPAYSSRAHGDMEYVQQLHARNKARQ